MTLPGFGVMTLSGFIYPWLLLLAAVPAVLAGLYVANQIQRRRRLERFADPDLMNTVSPRSRNRWRHGTSVVKEDFNRQGDVRIFPDTRNRWASEGLQ